MVDEFSYSVEEKVFVHIPTGLYIAELDLLDGPAGVVAERYEFIGMTIDDVLYLKGLIRYGRREREELGLPIL